MVYDGGVYEARIVILSHALNETQIEIGREIQHVPVKGKAAILNAITEWQKSEQVQARKIFVGRVRIVLNWLKENAYLAAWLALPVAIVVGLVQNSRTDFKELDWPRSLMYIAFLTALPVVFTPTFDETARSSARNIVFALLGVLIVDRRRRP